MANTLIGILYGLKETEDVFGTTSPTVAERTAYFDRCWDQWADNETTLEKSISKQRIRRNVGPYDFVRRGDRIRFKDKESLIRYLFDVSYVSTQ